MWHCFACGVGGNGWALAAFIAGFAVEDKPNVAKWLRGRGLISAGGRIRSADAERATRERLRLEAAAKKLTVEERRLRVAFAAKVRDLEALAQDLVDLGREVVEYEQLLASLPDQTRWALAAYNILAFAPAAERARFVLRPAARHEMIQAALLHGVRTADGRVMEVTL